MHMFCLRLYLVCGLILLSLNANAQTQTHTLINGIKVDAMGVTSARLASNGEVLQGIQFRAQSGTNAPKFFERAVQFNKATTGASIKNFAKRNAGAIGVTAATLAIGWILDQITKDIYQEQPNGSVAMTCNPYYSTGAYFTVNACSGSLNQKWHSQCKPFATSNYGSSAVCNMTLPLPATSQSVNGTITWNGGSSVITEVVTKNNSSYNQPAIPSSIAPATNQQTGDSVLPALKPDALPKLHTDPNTGAVQDTQEVLNKKAEVANDYARELNPSSVNAPAPTASTTASESQPNKAPTDQLAFCTYASAVCDFITWVKELPPSDNLTFTFAGMIEEQEVEVENYSSGMGSGSCPAPQSIMLMGNSIPFKFNSLCDFASILSFFLLAGAYLGSVFILLGIKR